MSSELSFFKRHVFDPGKMIVLALMTCAERPSINYIRRVTKVITEAAPVVIAEDLRELYDLRKVWDKDIFESEFERIFDRFWRAVDEHKWVPSEKLTKALHQKHLITNDGTSPENDWRQNLAAQIKSIRYCHLRSIAKKGADLDDTPHFPAHFTGPDDEACAMRVRAAFEVLTKEDIYLQAQVLLKRAVDQMSDKGKLLEVYCLRPVKDYEDTKNSYNFLTATYAQLLRDNLKRAAKEMYSGLGVMIIDHPVMMLTHTNRTNASPFGRILKQPLSKVDGIEGKNVVIIDDHVNAGAFCATLASQADECGANIIGFAAYSQHPNSKCLAIIPELRFALVKLYPDTLVDELLECLGLSIDTLTNREALTLLAIFSDPKDPVQKKEFQHVCKLLCEKEVLHGIQDNLLVEMRKPPVKLEELAVDIKEMFASGRLR